MQEDVGEGVVTRIREGPQAEAEEVVLPRGQLEAGRLLRCARVGRVGLALPQALPEERREQLQSAVGDDELADGGQLLREEEVARARVAVFALQIGRQLFEKVSGLEALGGARAAHAEHAEAAAEAAAETAAEAARAPAELGRRAGRHGRGEQVEQLLHQHARLAQVLARLDEQRRLLVEPAHVRTSSMVQAEDAVGDLRQRCEEGVGLVALHLARVRGERLGRLQRAPLQQLLEAHAARVRAFARARAHEGAQASALSARGGDARVPRGAGAARRGAGRVADGAQRRGRSLRVQMPARSERAARA